DRDRRRDRDRPRVMATRTTATTSRGRTATTSATVDQVLNLATFDDGKRPRAREGVDAVWDSADLDVGFGAARQQRHGTTTHPNTPGCQWLFGTVDSHTCPCQMTRAPTW